MMERIWNTKNNMPYKDFMKNLNATDTRLSELTGDKEQDSVLIGHNHREPIN